MRCNHPSESQAISGHFLVVFSSSFSLEELSNFDKTSQF